jgi:hypothetical protein
MGKNSSLGILIFLGILMTITGFYKIINLEAIPSKSLCYNIGHYCGTYARAFVGVVLVCKGVQNLK